METTKYDGVFHESKLLWSFGNFSRFVRPGMIRVEANLSPELEPEQQVKDLMASAYYNAENQQVIFVLINDTKEVKKLKLSNDNIQLSESYITSAKKDLEFAKVKKNKIVIPPRAVVTLVGQVEAGK